MKLTFVTVAVLSLAMFGCGRKAPEKVAEEIIEKQMAKDGIKGSVNLSENAMTIQTKEGTASIASEKNAKVPETFPKDVLMYSGATVLSTITVPQGFNLTLETTDSIDTVAAGFKSKMKENGWSSFMEMNQGGSMILMFQKEKEKRSVNLNLTQSDGKTQVNLTVMQEK